MLLRSSGHTTLNSFSGVKKLIRQRHDHRPDVGLRTEKIRKRVFNSLPDFSDFLVGWRGFEPPTPAVWRRYGRFCKYLTSRGKRDHAVL